MFEREITEARRLCLEAGRIIVDLYGEDIEVGYKGASDPVTEADTRVNAHVTRELRRLFPQDGVVAEETEDQSDALRKGRCWYVDPLDGTKEFIARNGEFAVMIGLAIDGAAKLGVIYQPAFDRLFRGVVDEGAVIEEGGRTDALRVSDTADPSKLRLVVSRSHRSEATDRFVQRLGITDEHCSGSVGLKIGIVSTRRADLYVHLSEHTSRWDSCGPEAIVRAAGGRFSDLAGRPFFYGGDDMKNRGGILACNAAAFDAVLPVAHEIGRELGMVD